MFLRGKNIRLSSMIKVFPFLAKPMSLQSITIIYKYLKCQTVKYTTHHSEQYNEFGLVNIATTGLLNTYFLQL